MAATAYEAQRNTLDILYAVYKFLNDSLFFGRLPENEVLISLIHRAKEDTTLGWFRGRPNTMRISTPAGEIDGFVYEIGIMYNTLSFDWITVSETLLHEMCHLSAHIFSSHTGHGEPFRDACKKYGLLVKETEKGWTQTSLTEESRNLISEYLSAHGYDRPLIYRKAS